MDSKNITTLKKFCEDNGSVFICPYSDESTHVLVMSELGLTLEPVEELEDLDRHSLNHNCVVGMLRKGVELGIFAFEFAWHIFKASFSLFSSCCSQTEWLFSKAN